MQTYFKPVDAPAAGKVFESRLRVTPQTLSESPQHQFLYCPCCPLEDDQSQPAFRRDRLPTHFSQRHKAVQFVPSRDPSGGMQAGALDRFVRQQQPAAAAAAAAAVAAAEAAAAAAASGPEGSSAPGLAAATGVKRSRRDGDHSGVTLVPLPAAAHWQQAL